MRGRARRDLRDREWSRNTGPALATVLLVLDDPPSGVTLVNASGTTSCTSPSGSPFVAVPAIASGKRVIVHLDFSDPSGAPIAFTPQVLAGPGTP